MSEEEFLSRTPPFMGDILWAHLELLRRGKHDFGYYVIVMKLATDVASVAIYYYSIYISESSEEKLSLKNIPSTFTETHCLNEINEKNSQSLQNSLDPCRLTDNCQLTNGNQLTQSLSNNNTSAYMNGKFYIL